MFPEKPHFILVGAVFEDRRKSTRIDIYLENLFWKGGKSERNQARELGHPNATKTTLS